MKKYAVIFGLIILIASVSAVSAGLFDSNAQDNGIITIESDDHSMKGTVEIYEFKNIKENDDDTYNVTQFYDHDGFQKRKKHRIVIKDSTAEYKLHNDTEFFIIYYFITDIKPYYDLDNETAPMVNVEYLFNGKSMLSSSEEAYFDQCDISFGDSVYKVNGDPVDLNIDDSELDYLGWLKGDKNEIKFCNSFNYLNCFYFYHN